MATLYLDLGVPADASAQDIRVAFKRCALQVHPDKGGTKEAFQRIMLAFDVLSDPEARRRYDLRLLTTTCHIGHPCMASTKRKRKAELLVYSKL